MKALLLLAAFLLPLVALATDRAETDWNAVLALEAGPQNLEIHSREEARTVTLAHLYKQEAGLRNFLREHPGSLHVVDAQLRLARLLATRCDLTGKAAFYQAAQRLLNEALASAPEERRADVAFAQIALGMLRMPVPTDRDRDLLTGQMNAFQTHYPNDRRVASLIAEVATLFDDQPRRKQALLNQALAAARTPELRARIEDDLRRLALLGRPIELRGKTATGADFDLAQFRGKVSLVYFFASWSPPSLAGIAEVEYLRKTFAKETVAVIGVSLDPTPEVLDATLKVRAIPWPVLFDGKGWKSPLVRSLSINALPTLWVIDRQGKLRTLNAKTESEALVRELLKEP
ncbi:MAG: TlpA disulfide reductase family protein [Verrucomicrobia bacterium]|nr:TlpA disulfide reductase family protein [Verrucomicrobiota bacterium]